MYTMVTLIYCVHVHGYIADNNMYMYTMVTLHYCVHVHVYDGHTTLLCTCTWVYSRQQHVYVYNGDTTLLCTCTCVYSRQQHVQNLIYTSLRHTCTFLQRATLKNWGRPGDEANDVPEM